MRDFGSIVEQRIMSGSIPLRKSHITYEVDEGWIIKCSATENEIIVVPPTINNQVIVGIADSVFESISPQCVYVLSDGSNKVSLHKDAFKGVGEAHIYAHVKRSELPKNAQAHGKVLEDMYVVGSKCKG